MEVNKEPVVLWKCKPRHAGHYHYTPATLDDLRAAAKELGMVVVPEEPTDEMERAVIRLGGDWDDYVNPFVAYQAMIKAAQEEV